jgi:hypothetical protein
MPRRKVPGKAIRVAPLSRTEKRAERVDAYVKDLLANERKADEIKRQKLKALRIAQTGPASEPGT